MENITLSENARAKFEAIKQASAVSRLTSRTLYDSKKLTASS